MYTLIGHKIRIPTGPAKEEIWVKHNIWIPGGSGVDRILKKSFTVFVIPTALFEKFCG